MLFNSFHFILFFPLVFILYYWVSPSKRQILLLLSSYYFYMSWKPTYAILILASTAIDYIIGLRIPKSHSKGRAALVCTSLAFNLGLLFLFKYLNFFSRSFNQLFVWLDQPFSLPPIDLLLPVGISFYTFQTLSYTLDVYRGVKAPERSFVTFALYVSFFPQLVAGPIERSTHLLPQFHRFVSFDYRKVRDGLRMILWGFIKKVVIADHLALYADQVFNHPTSYQGTAVLLAAYFFAFQIYCDFSGYSDIAIGTAKCLGFDLMNNFYRPYFSASVREFWTRWHMSLSTWFKDYVYIPLGGNRRGPLRNHLNLIAVFLISGLWHGANWTFVLWGALHGLLLSFERFLGLGRQVKGMFSWLRLCQVLIVFHLVTLAWIFFRANSVSDAFLLIENLFKFGPHTLPDPTGFRLNRAVQSILLLTSVEYFRGRLGRQFIVDKWPRTWRWLIYWLLIVILFLYGRFDSQSFIYFQF